MARMFGWESTATARASRSKRASRSVSCANGSGRTLTATSRPRRVSRARYTSPMPPAPNCPVISYGPNLVPVVIIGSDAGGAGLRRSEGRLHVRLIQVPENQDGNGGAHDTGAEEEWIEM